MNITAYDIAVERISRIPIYCDKPEQCTQGQAIAEIQRALKALNQITYMYPPSTLYVYELDKVYDESGLVIAKLIQEYDQHQALKKGQFTVHA